MLSSVIQDVTFALRQIRRSPGFAITAIITLALGIGATTAVYGLFDGILLHPLPFPHAERLVAIDTLEFPPGLPSSNPAAADPVGSSYPDFFDWKQQARSFESLASYDAFNRLFSKADGVGARVIPGGRVSANLFSTLGVLPVLGRTFTAEEEQPGHRVVILSHELWVSDFGASPDVIGQMVNVSDEPSTIVGVMPAGFHYPVGQPGLFWATFAADTEGQVPNTSKRDRDSLAVVGRLKDGARTEQALAELNSIQLGLAQRYSEDRFHLAVAINPLLDEAISDIRPVLWLLLAAVGAVLIIGCANVAGLLLARANGRRSEVALRTALGASRARVVRQLLMEAMLLAIAGGAVGVWASIALLRIGVHLIPSDVPRLYNVGINARVLVFAVVLSGATAIIFGLLPALRMSRSDSAHALRDSSFTTTSGRHRNRLHHALVIAQTGLGFTLLILSGLLIKSMMNLLHLDPGFDTTRTVFFDVALTKKRYPDPNKVDFYKKLLPELAALPGVERVASGHPVAGVGSGNLTTFTVAGRAYSRDDLPTAVEAVATPGYFETLSIPLLHGRTFTLHDDDQKFAPVAIINQSFARRYFPGEDPVGRYFTPSLEDATKPVVAWQIIGVVGDTRNGDPWDVNEPEFFLPYAQDPDHQRPIVVMKVSGDPLGYENTVRGIVARLDRDAPVFGYASFASQLELQSA